MSVPCICKVRYLDHLDQHHYEEVSIRLFEVEMEVACKDREWTILREKYRRSLRSCGEVEDGFFI